IFLDLQATIQGASSDTQPPTAPTLSAGSTRAGSADLSWTPSTDDVAVAGYLVERDGSPLAVVGAQASTYVDGPVDTSVPHTYVVSAFDTGGNMQDSAAVPVTPRDPTADPDLLAFGSAWRWSYQGAAPAGPWTAVGYDDSLWASGAGEFGFGDSPKGTVITTAPSPRPLTSYYRRTVTIAEPTRFRAIALDLIRNSGAVVYVNGVEVGRSNMPEGPVTADTYAATYVGAADRKVPFRIQVPTSAFRAGANTIAVELHLNGRTQPTAGFDLKITGLSP
ncbi:MAG: hypothetical protein JWM47_3094, partial [Acidimicrobiales bacterium]|nr:hypothetical protein [Acidimicrobiales bacterium]